MFCCHFQIVALPNLAPGQDVELVARAGPGGQDLVARVGNLDPAEVARTLQANPEIAQVRTCHNIRDDQLEYTSHTHIPFLTGAGQTDPKGPQHCRGKKLTNHSQTPFPNMPTSPTPRPSASPPSWPTKTKSCPPPHPSPLLPLVSHLLIQLQDVSKSLS